MAYKLQNQGSVAPTTTDNQQEQSLPSLSAAATCIAETQGFYGVLQLLDMTMLLRTSGQT